ncbi:GNAT family N-acetyltransferase [Nocardioides sp. C4-1]|uniref:GNAT family N-acetyltransferase n=1 Tax=Nocardioides sp. C4-1 TaxID=3151851 RepID=UPI003263EB4D
MTALDKSSGVVAAVGRAASGRAAHGGGIVLAYHDVVGTRTELRDPLDVTLAQLVTHVKVVRRLGFEVVPLDAIGARAARGEPTDGLAAIAFDDALEGVARHALPALVELDAPATLMVVGDGWGEHPAWWPQMGRTMTGVELAEAVTLGFDIAAHTRTHVSLAGLEPGRLRDEVCGTRDRLEQLQGRAVTQFAYPFGHFDRAALDAVADAGYEAAYTFLNGRIGVDDDRLRLPRLTMGQHHDATRLAYHLARPAGTWPDHQLDRVVEQHTGDVIPTAGLRCELVSDPARAADLADAWDALADEVGAGPLVRPSYALTWWHHVGQGRLLVGAVHDGDRLVALAPLHERRAGPIGVVRWLGHGLGTVSEVLVAPGRDDAATLLWTTLLSPRRVLDLVEARADSPALAALVALDRPRRPVTVTPRDRCPVTELGETGLAHLEAPSARHARRVLRRADRDLAADGRTYSVQVAVDRAKLEELLPDLRQVFDHAEAAAPKQHLLHEPWGGFTLDYLRREADAGRCITLVAYVDEHPVSFLLALLTPSTATMSLFTTRYDPAGARYSPGHLMFRETFRIAPDHGVRRVDMLLGVSQTKRQWSNGGYDTVEVRAGSSAAWRVVDAAVALAERRNHRSDISSGSL